MYPKKNVPKNLSSHMVVKASLKATPQNHNKMEKIPTLRAFISGCPHIHTGFSGVIVSTQAYLHEQHFIFMLHPRLLQEIELECDKKFHLSNRKILMVEASSLTELFIYRNLTCKFLKQNCKINLCGSACATENIALKFTLFVTISLISCKNLYGFKQALLLVESKRLSDLSDSLKLLKVQDNKIKLGFMCSLVINYSAYQTYVTMSVLLRVLI